jgi:hypothetical protein
MAKEKDRKTKKMAKEKSAKKSRSPSKGVLTCTYNSSPSAKNGVY